MSFHHHATLCIAAYGFLICQWEAIPPSASWRPKMPLLRKGFRPSGAIDPAGTPCRKLDRDDHKTSHRCAQKHTPCRRSCRQERWTAGSGNFATAREGRDYNQRDLGAVAEESRAADRNPSPNSRRPLTTEIPNFFCSVIFPGIVTFAKYRRFWSRFGSTTGALKR